MPLKNVTSHLLFFISFITMTRALLVNSDHHRNDHTSPRGLVTSPYSYSITLPVTETLPNLRGSLSLGCLGNSFRRLWKLHPEHQRPLCLPGRHAGSMELIWKWWWSYTLGKGGFDLTPPDLLHSFYCGAAVTPQFADVFLGYCTL